MKYWNGVILTEEDLIAIYPRRIVKNKNYEVWQHHYINDGILHVDFEIQLVIFESESKVSSYYFSSSLERLYDKNHIGRMQLVFHDVCLNFEEHFILVEDIYSEEVFNKIKVIVDGKIDIK